MANIIQQEATCLVKSYYTSYSRYVLETRALPSVYDGFKFSQRRLIFVGAKKPTKFGKSANLLGDTIPYHPHGLDSLYSTLVGMTTPTNQFRLFRGKGNWGGAGFGAAAYRYTEAFLEDYARFCYTQFVNYATYEQGETGLDEPVALPSLVPYSNLVGSSGIGVGLSTNIMPLNLMELIDYYLAIIKGEEEVRIPTPDLGHFILDMDDQDIDDASSGIDAKLVVKSVITQESDNVIVIEDLLNKSISTICDKIGDLLDSGKVDFRDESSDRTRFVFEIKDSSVSMSELVNTLSHYTTSRVSFTRLVVENKKAVYCNLKYQVTKTLEYLNKVLDNKFKVDLAALQFKEQVLLVIEHLKTSGLLNQISTMSSDDLKTTLVNAGFDKDAVNSAVGNRITYLTKSHNDELVQVRKDIANIKSINRTDYLVELYEKFKEMVSPLYESKPHTIRRSDLLTTPKIKKSSTHSVLISNSGYKFNDSIVLITKSGYAQPMKAFSSTRREIELDGIDDLVDIATDYTTDVILLFTNKEGILALEYNRLTYGKQVINLDDDEYVTKISRLKCNEKGEALFNYGKIDYDAKRFLRVKLSKPFRNWTL